MIDELTREHRALASTWQRLRPAFAELAAGAPATIESKDIEELIARCERLFRLEDEELLPMADRLLERRGARPDRRDDARPSP